MARFDDLWDAYFSETLTEAEVREFLELIDREDCPLPSAIDDLLRDGTLASLADKTREKVIFEKILGRAKVRRIVMWCRVAAAAAIIFALATGTYLLLNRSKTPEKSLATKVQVNDVAPGGDKAILTLANGKKIILDTAAKTISGESGVTIINSKGSLSYEQQKNRTAETAYNTITTPRGGQYKLKLSDGTKVWLDAESSIRYPTVFAGNERVVEITGQAYFEVVHNSRMPFKVLVNGTEIQDLGTEFNVNGYQDDALIKTTLVNGSVKVVNKNKSQSLAPGEQAVLDENGNISLIRNADVDAAIAWKNGYFQFTGMGIAAVMRQLERWYDITVSYEGKIPERKFAGQIDRSANLSQVLTILQESNIHFRLEGRKLTVTP